MSVSTGRTNAFTRSEIFRNCEMVGGTFVRLKMAPLFYIIVAAVVGIFYFGGCEHQETSSERYICVCELNNCSKQVRYIVFI